MTTSSFARRRLTDLRAAIVTIPAARTWGACAIVYGAFLIVAVPIGWSSGVLRLALTRVSTPQIAAASLMVLVHPAFVEEIVFRGVLLPRDWRSLSGAGLAVVVVSALAIYVASHPLNAWLFRPAALPLFSSLPYLFLAALLGLACTGAYLISRSIWPPVVIHWVTVVVWLWFLGGERVLAGRS